MTKRLDRSIQRAILEELADCYAGWSQLTQLQATAGELFESNFVYLLEHGLVEATFQDTMHAGGRELGEARCTYKGMDFLQDDGGLSAILGVVTVRLHADTLRELLAAKVEASTLPPAEKESLLKHLRTLPTKALETATERLVTAGIDSLPDAVQWLRTLVESFRTGGG